MISFTERKEKALKQWESLIHNKIPVIYVGSATCGKAAGAIKLIDAIRETLKSSELKAKIIEVGCIGPCYMEPLMDIKKPGYPRISYAGVTPEKAKKIIRAFLIEDDPSVHMAVAHFATNGQNDSLNIPYFFDLPMLKSQVRLVLRNCGFIDPENIDHYLANDGYQGLIKALEIGPRAVISEVKEAGLRGRGGAGFPAYKKWEICRDAPGKEKYMICNVSEGDPGAFMNRALIEGDPHCVLEGLLIAAYAIGANHGYIYINTDYVLAIER
ncbi:MAG: NADH-quinone oxidoreductase subunit F, partial [Calditrichia bacterium]|nr:NADH-quinone oxidoreductase subunit F [Calditrichia bacterium]